MFNSLVTKNQCMYRLIQFLSILLFVSISVDVNAQTKSSGNYNFREFESKPFYFGIQFGGNSSGYKIKQSRSFYQEDSLNVVESPLKPGASISFIANLKIGQYFDFRSTPGFNFAERTFEYLSDENVRTRKSLETYTFDIPLLLRFKSAPYKDKRFFIVAGVKYVYDFSSNVNSDSEKVRDLMVLSPHDFQVEFGMGMQIFLPYFIFSPQITFSQSISNIHISKQGLLESRIIDQVLSRVFSFYINLEG